MAAGLGPGYPRRLCPGTEFGVLDHVVTTTSGETVAVPMRATSDGAGAEVVFIRAPPAGYGLDAELDRDVGLVARILRRQAAARTGADRR